MPLESSILLVTARPAAILSIEKVLLGVEVVTRLTPIQNGPDILEVEYRLRKTAETMAVRPRLILFDLNRKDASQMTLLTAIKSDPCLCTIPVIILSEAVFRRHRGPGLPVELIRLRDLICSMLSSQPEAGTDALDRSDGSGSLA